MTESRGPIITEETIRQLALLAGLEVPAEQLARLAAELQLSLAGTAALDELDLEGIIPGTIFDARWDR